MEQAIALRRWAKKLPPSRMIYPDTLGKRLKYFIWHILTPFYTHLREVLLWLGLLKYAGRQDYLIGKIAPTLTIQEFILFLIGHGYGNHFVAMEDEGQLVSLRRVDSFVWQYHVRVFEDGEVRAHFEYTPECHPLLHMRVENTVFEDKRGEFLALVGNRIVRA